MSDAAVLANVIVKLFRQVGLNVNVVQTSSILESCDFQVASARKSVGMNCQQVDVTEVDDLQRISLSYKKFGADRVDLIGSAS